MQNLATLRTNSEVRSYFAQAVQLLLDHGLVFSNNPEMIWTRTGEGSFSGQWQERFTSNVGYVFHRVEASIESLYQAMPSVQQWAVEVGSYFPNHRYISSQQRLPTPIVLGIDRILRILGYLLSASVGSSGVPLGTAVGLALAQLYSYLESGKSEYQSWMFVLASTLINGELLLSDGICLRELTDDEAHHVANGPGMFHVLGMDSPFVYQNMRLFDWFDARTHQTVIEIREVRDGKGDEVIGAHLGIVLDLVSAIRLVKGGSVSAAQYWLQDGNPWAPWPYSVQRASAKEDPPWRRDATRINLNDAREIGALYQALHALPAESSLRRVLSRVDDAFRRDRDDDRLLDCWMGLEMLFTDPAKRVSFNPAGIYRCAWYLGGGYLERSRVFEHLRLASGRRNNLVHRSHQLDRDRIRQSAEEAEKLLVESLRKAILEGVPPNLEELDTKLLGSAELS